MAPARDQGPPGKPPSANKRHEILNVAEQHLGRFGYQGVALAAIANEIGISKPSLYYHFPGGKQEIFVAILTRSLAEARDGLESVIASPGNSRLKLEAAIRWLMNEPGRGRGVELMHDVMRFVDEKYHANVNEAYLDAHFQPICRVVAAGMNAGELRQADAAFTTWSILGLIAGLMEVQLLSAQFSTPEFEVSRIKMADNVVMLVIHGLKSDA